jgi:hypothetical protein
MLVVRDGLPLNSSGRAKLDRVRPWFVGETRQREWPGTTLLSGESCIKEYSFDSGCCRMLSTLVEGLYGWRSPDAPEDLCLLRSEGSPALVSIAHEADSYLEITSLEMHKIELACPGWSQLLKRLRTPKGTG